MRAPLVVVVAMCLGLAASQAYAQGAVELPKGCGPGGFHPHGQLPDASCCNDCMAAACSDYLDKIDRASGAYEACFRLRVPALRGICNLTLDRLTGCRTILNASRRAAVLALKRKLKRKTPDNGGCKGLPLSCKLTQHNVRLLCEPETCMFPTTTTSSTTTTTISTPTTTTSTTATTITISSAATSLAADGDACQRRCVNNILKHCFEDCIDACDGDSCALRMCQRGCRNFNCDELNDRCTTEGSSAQDYIFCCKTAGEDDCSDTVECTQITTTTLKTTTTTTVTTTTTTAPTTTTLPV